MLAGLRAVSDSTPDLPARRRGRRSRQPHLETRPRAILSPWLSILLQRPSCATGTWLRSGVSDRFRPGPSGWPSGTWRFLTVRDGAGCSVQRTASGTAASASAGCRLTHLDASSALRAGTATLAGTASVSNAGSASTASRRATSRGVALPARCRRSTPRRAAQAPLPATASTTADEFRLAPSHVRRTRSSGRTVPPRHDSFRIGAAAIRSGRSGHPRPGR
jgi:hypothetical protein